MANVSGISFGQTVDVLSNAISGAGLEQDQIANNIANVDTPNFRVSTTSFRDALKASLGTPPPSDQLGLETNNARQFALGDATPPQAFNPVAHVDENTQMRADKSNVDIDQETALLAANSGYEQTMAKLLGQQYKTLREVIQEQPM